MNGHKSADASIDYEHGKREESHLIPMKVHLMKQPTEPASRKARDQGILSDGCGQDERPAGYRKNDVKQP
jgi:hypothetical protein